MAKQSKIEWTDATWNPWYGCHKVSAGCQNCYMDRWAKRAGRNPDQVTRSRSTFYDPLKWKESKRIFVCSLSDFFIEEADRWRQEAENIIKSCPQHTFIIPTKRTDRLFNCLVRNGGKSPVSFPNVWLLASTENQIAANERLLELQKLREYGLWPVLGISAEPLLGKINFIKTCNIHGYQAKAVDWVIIGAESGPNRRECKIEDVRSLVRQGKDAGVPVFVKQLHINQKLSRDMNEWPEDLRIREFPEVIC